MRFFLKLSCYAALLVSSVSYCQDITLPPPTRPGEEKDRKLPNGKSQNEEILKADYEKSLKDAAELVDLTQALKKALENDTGHVLSIAQIKRTEEIEKIAKRIRGRMQRF
jgi:hypothetical protein